jgi:predicted transcriptional regulator
MSRMMIGLLVSVSLLCAFANAADNLRLNQRLDYTSDSQDGPLISGDHLEDGAAAGMVNYVIMYGEGCFNSKRQARRTVSLWDKYRGQVNFVVIDLDHKQSKAQEELVSKYYRGYIPHVVVLDKSGNASYNQSGEVEESAISAIIDHALAAK